MAKTIIQTIGPLYGEVVNGTVFGRPNGSIFVPISNTISISIDAPKTIQKLPTNALRVTGFFHAVAESQDLASNIVISVFEDSALTQQFGTSRSITAGIFNGTWGDISYSTVAPTSGTSYYVVAQLMNNGVPVATSNVVEVTGV